MACRFLTDLFWAITGFPASKANETQMCLIWCDLSSASGNKMKWRDLCVNGKPQIFEKRGVLEYSGCRNDYFKNRLWTPRVYIYLFNYIINIIYINVSQEKS